MSNSIYSQYVFADKLISPVTGYSCRRIFKLNIHKFGFNSIEELHESFPGFPIMCGEATNSVRSSANTFAKTKSSRERQQYELSPKVCPHCNDTIPFQIRNNKFCSQSCAATFTNLRRPPKSDKEKLNISAGLRIFNVENAELIAERNKIRAERASILQSKNCEICENTFLVKSIKTAKRTCSEDCFRTLQARNASVQKVHGGGKKGIYKGFHCDSTYELAFLIYHLDHAIPINRCTETRSYVYDGRTKLYTPDFVVNGTIHEIKGFMSNQAIAKLDQNPDIVLIDKTKIKPYIDYVKQTYNVKNIEVLYEISNDKLLTLVCKQCSNEFQSRKSNRVFCSRSCAGKHIARKF